MMRPEVLLTAVTMKKSSACVTVSFGRQDRIQANDILKSAKNMFEKNTQSTTKSNTDLRKSEMGYAEVMQHKWT
jgi:hypothetical protein